MTPDSRSELGPQAARQSGGDAPRDDVAPRQITAASELELLARALAEEQEHAVILLDPEGRVVSWLPGATRILGHPAADMLGSTLRRVFPPEDLARGDLDWELNTARAYGKVENDRWQVRKDGVRIWVSGVTTCLHNDDGMLIGFSKIVRDRTNLRTHLEVLHSRFVSASEAANERLIVLGTLAHELLNPLGSLTNAAQLIRMVDSNKPQIESSLQLIERQVRFIASLVKDLLEATRVAVGKAELHYASVQLREVLEKAIETCSAGLDDKGQTVEMPLPPALFLDADSVRLQQVFVNLIANSSKFSPPGSTIWIKANADADELVVRVEDKGRGIPGGLLTRVFDHFTQADSEGGSPEHGLGLGLGLVKSIVEMHSGTVQARSEGHGKGTEIIVRLPLRQPQPIASN